MRLDLPVARVGPLRRGDDHRLQRLPGHFQRHAVVAQRQPLGQPEPFDHVVDPFHVAAAPGGQLRHAAFLPQRLALFEVQPALIGGGRTAAPEPAKGSPLCRPGHRDRRGDGVPRLAAVRSQGLGGVFHPLQRGSQQSQHANERLRRSILTAVGHVEVAGLDPVAGRQFGEFGGRALVIFSSCRLGM